MFACIRALVNFMKDKSSAFLLVQYVTQIDIIPIMIEAYKNEVLEELEGDAELIMKTRLAAGEFILMLSEDETVDNVRDIFIEKRIDTVC